MKPDLFSRRNFLKRTSFATLGAAASTGFRFPQPAEARQLAALGGAAVRRKPFSSWPPVSPELEKSLIEAFRSRRWGRSLQGPMVGEGLVCEFERRFARLLGVRYCLATGSCTQALHTALHAVGVGPGDEVLVPPCTFIATVQAILLCGALPVFVDVDLETFQMDPAKIEPLITPETRAIEPVHIAGLPCDIERIVAIAEKHRLAVVEDAAQAHLALFRDKPCGTFGQIGCFSFQNSKQIACGEGGALVTNDAQLAERSYVFHNLGLSPRQQSVGLGTKYRMHELEAALLLPQLETLTAEIQRRHDNAAYLAKRLSEIPGIIPQRLYPGTTRGAYYLFGFRYLRENFGGVAREKFLRALRAEGIPFTTMYFDQLNKQPFLTAVLSSPGFQKVFSADRLRRYHERNQCPNNDLLAEQGVWLPQYVLLGEKQDIDDIADAIAKISENKDHLSKL